MKENIDFKETPEVLSQNSLLKEVAFLDDLSGRRRFLQAEKGNLYFMGPEDQTPQEVNNENLQSALEKHGFVLSDEQPFKALTEFK